MARRDTILNRTNVDIDDSSVRFRIFGGRSAEDIAEDMPILPVNAPFLPPPGINLLRQGESMGDPPVELKKGKPHGRPCGVWVTAVVRSALYQADTLIRLEGSNQLFQPGLIRDGTKSGVRYGPSPCRLMVVGKCLSQIEVSTGEPFYGRGSSDLWRAWNESGLPRPGLRLPTYLTNLVPFCPPVTMTRIPADVIADGTHLLYQQFAMARPDVILSLGAEATKAILGRGATVTNFRGRVGKVSCDFRPTLDSPPDIWSASVIVADHPAAVFKAPDKYDSLLSSMRHLSRYLGFGNPLTSSVIHDHQMVLTTAELEQAVNDSIAKSANGGYISFDCEWDGKHPTASDAYLYTIQWSHAPGHARVVFLRRCGGSINQGIDHGIARDLLNKLIVSAPDRGARLVGHFAKADLPWLHSFGVDAYPVYVGPRDDPPGPDAVSAEFKTNYEGAFDTYVAAACIDESAPRKLEILAATILGIDRYDTPITDWIAAYCKKEKIKKTELSGYGEVPEDVLFPYAAMDCDATGRLYLHQNGDFSKGIQGLLDKDRFGNSSRQIFAIRMRAFAALAEMERYGLEVDKVEQRRLSEIIRARFDGLMEEIKNLLNWPDGVPGYKNFKISKTQDLVEVLFGETLTKKGKARPNGALSLYLTPYKATNTTGSGRLWEDAMYRYTQDGGVRPLPSTDAESLNALRDQHQLVDLIIQAKDLSTALKIVFRPPDERDEDADEEDSEDEYSAGLMALVDPDNRVRTTLGFIETGRLSSSRPNMQNTSTAADERLMRILKWGDEAPEGSPDRDKKFVSQSIFRAREGWFLVDADLKGAEIAAAGWGSGDPLLIEHARRSTLNKKDPEWLDLHSDLAKTAFKLKCPLSEVAAKHKPYRVAAKRARFGHYYGASPDTIWRQCLQESRNVKLEDVRTIVIEHDKTYPMLTGFFGGSRARVTEEGWLRNGFGGMRRFRPSSDREVLAGQQREAQNWTCQGLVADAGSYALGNLWYAIRDLGLKSRILLAIHDSIVTECPPEEVEFVHDELIPWAMGSGTPIIPTDFNGIPNGRGPYFFGVSTAVCRVWGKPLKDSEWRKPKETASKL